MQKIEGYISQGSSRKPMAYSKWAIREKFVDYKWGSKFKDPMWNSCTLPYDYQWVNSPKPQA